MPTSANPVGNPRQRHLNRGNPEKEQMNLVALASQLPQERDIGDTRSRRFKPKVAVLIRQEPDLLQQQPASMHGRGLWREW